jgi:hypothetical protein
MHRRSRVRRRRQAEHIKLLIVVASLDTQGIRLNADAREPSGLIQRPGSKLHGVDRAFDLTHARKRAGMHNCCVDQRPGKATTPEFRGNMHPEKFGAVTQLGALRTDKTRMPASRSSTKAPKTHCDRSGAGVTRVAISSEGDLPTSSEYLALKAVGSPGRLETEASDRPRHQLP